MRGGLEGGLGRGWRGWEGWTCTGWCEVGGRRLTRCRNREQGEEDEVLCCASWGVMGPGRAHMGTQATPLHTEKHSHVCTHSPIRVHAARTYKPTQTGLCDTTYTCRYTHPRLHTYTHAWKAIFHKLYHVRPPPLHSSTTNPCRGRSLIIPISHESRLSLADKGYNSFKFYHHRILAVINSFMCIIGNALLLFSEFSIFFKKISILFKNIYFFEIFSWLHTWIS